MGPKGKLYERHIRELKDLHEDMSLKLAKFDNLMDVISTKKSTVLGKDRKTTTYVKNIMLSIQKCREKLDGELEKWTKLTDMFVREEESSPEHFVSDDTDVEDDSHDTRPRSMSSSTTSSLNTIQSNIEISPPKRLYEDNDDIHDDTPGTEGPTFTVSDKKRWMIQMKKWLANYNYEGKSSDDIILEIENENIHENDMYAKSLTELNKDVLANIMNKLTLNDDFSYNDVLDHVNTFGNLFMTLFEYKNIYISVEKLKFMYENIHGKESSMWYVENPVTGYKDGFGIFIKHLYKKKTPINIESWISSFNIDKKYRIDAISGFIGVQSAKIYRLFETYLDDCIPDTTKHIEVVDERIAFFLQSYGSIIAHLDEETKKEYVKFNFTTNSIDDLLKHNIIGGVDEATLRPIVVSLKRVIIYKPNNEKAKIRNRYVQKLWDKRLYTYEEVHIFFENCPFLQDNWIYFGDAFQDFSNPTFQKFFAKNIVICWYMDNRHVYNVAKCIELFINELDINDLTWKVEILKNVLCELCEINEDKEADSIEVRNVMYQLIGELSDILPTESADRIRKLLFTQKQTDLETVFRGEYALTLVEKQSPENGGNYGLYKIVEKPMNHRNKNVDDILLLKETELTKSEYIHSTDSEYTNWLHHKRSYIRIASWNVSCTNGFDVPKTEGALHEKLDNIVTIVLKSFSDIIALQELPLKLSVKKSIEDDTKVQYHFNDIKEILLKKLYEKTFHNWEIVYSTAFHETTSVIKTKKTEGQEVYAFLFNSDLISYTSIETEVQKVLDKRDKKHRLSRLPCFGKFKSNQLEIILCNMHLAPDLKNAKKEIRDLGKIVLPALKEQFSNGDYQKIMFVGDFNMSYTTKGCFSDPLPEYDTWLDFKNAQYGPCITGCFTNVLHNKCYDNIWIHYSLRHLRYFNRSLISTNTSDKGVFNMRHFPEIENEFNFGERNIIKFKKNTVIIILSLLI